MMPHVEYEECKLPEFPEGDIANGTDCRICGEEKTGLHYGVISCSDCRFFFRRTRLRKRELVCTKYDRCNLRGSKNRKKCDACRFNKCVKEGMVREDPRDWVQGIDLPGPSSSKVKCSSESSSDDDSLSHNSYCECCGSDSGESDHGESDDPWPGDRALVAEFKAALENNCNFMLELDFGKAKKMKNLFNLSRKEIWETMTKDVARVCSGVIGFANAIKDFKRMRVSDRIDHLQGSLFAMTILALSRGFDEELGQVQIGSTCYPKPSLLVSDEDLKTNRDLILIDQIFLVISEAWSFKLTADQLSIVMAMVLFEGAGEMDDCMRTLLIPYCPSVHFYCSIFDYVDRLTVVYYMFADRLQTLLEEMPFAQIPRVLIEFFFNDPNRAGLEYYDGLYKTASDLLTQEEEESS